MGWGNGGIGTGVGGRGAEINVTFFVFVRGGG